MQFSLLLKDPIQDKGNQGAINKLYAVCSFKNIPLYLSVIFLLEKIAMSGS